MELAPVLLFRSVEAVAPVDTEQTDHREEHPHADTCRTLDLERIELLDVRPAVTSLKEAQHEDRGLRLEDDRVTELHRELVIDIAGIVAVGVVRCHVPRRKGVVLVATEGDDIGSVGVVARHAVSSDPEALERRVTPSAVVVAKVAELRACHDHEVTDDLGVEFAADLPLVVLDPLVTVGRGPFVVVDVLVARHPDRIATGVKVA